VRVDRLKSTVDADTVRLAGGTGKGGSFRLVGFDAPESRQDPQVNVRGTEALRNMLGGRDVEVRPVAARSHGREAGRLVVDGVDAGVEMVRQGNGFAIRKERLPGFASADPAIFLAERAARAKAVADQRAGRELTVEEHGIWRDPALHERLKENVRDGGTGVFAFLRALFSDAATVPKFDVRGDPVGSKALIDDATVGTVTEYDPDEGVVTLQAPGGKRKTLLLTELAKGMGLVQFLPGFEKFDPGAFRDAKRGR